MIGLKYTSTDVTLMKFLCLLMIVAPYSHLVFNYGIFIFLAIVGISFYYLLKLLLSGSLPKYSILLLIFVAIWGIAWMNSPKQVFQESTATIRNTTELLTPAVGFFLLFFPYYFWSKTGCLTSRRLKKFLVILLIVNSISFIGFFADLIPHDADASGANLSYPLVCLMPLAGVLWDNKNKFFYVLLALVAVSFISTKRGAMISALLSFALMLYLFSKDSKYKHIKLLPIVLMLVAASAVLYFIYISNDNLQLKIEDSNEGNFSGRENFYLVLLDSWLSSDIKTKLLGTEFMKAVDLVGYDAHNDWLEILLDAGIVGATIYLFIILTFFIKGMSNRKLLASKEKYMLYSAMVIWLVRSFVSDGFTSIESRYFMVAIAFVLGRLDYYKNYSILQA